MPENHRRCTLAITLEERWGRNGEKENINIPSFREPHVLKAATPTIPCMSDCRNSDDGMQNCADGFFLARIRLSRVELVQRRVHSPIT